MGLALIVGILIIGWSAENTRYSMSFSGPYTDLAGQIQMGDVRPFQLFIDRHGAIRCWLGNRLVDDSMRTLQVLPDRCSDSWSRATASCRPVVDDTGALWLVRFAESTVSFVRDDEILRTVSTAALGTTSLAIDIDIRENRALVFLPDRVLSFDVVDTDSSPMTIWSTTGPAITAAAANGSRDVALAHGRALTLLSLKDGASRTLPLPGHVGQPASLCFAGDGRLVVATVGHRRDSARLLTLDLSVESPSWETRTRLPYVWDRGEITIVPSMAPSGDGTVTLLCAQDAEARGSAALFRVTPRDL